MKLQGESRIEVIQNVLDSLEEEQLLNREADFSDPVVDILIIGLHAYICKEVCQGNAQVRRETALGHTLPCVEATVIP